MEPRFDFGMNDSKIVETYYDKNHQPIRIPPDCVIDLATIESSYKNSFRPIANFLAEVKKRGNPPFYVQRTFALGDMLMLVPVVRHLRTLGYDPRIRTTSLFKDILELFDVQIELIMNSVFHVDEFGISLDGTIERDHWDEALSRFHRVYIYLKALGVEEMPEKVDWSYDFSRFCEGTVDTDNEPYVVFQDGGSTSRKQLAKETTAHICESFESRGVKVTFIGDEFGKIRTPLHLFNLIAGAKCIISMDSAPLWISHFTETPVVCILGPSRPEERLTLHPLYPEGAVGIELSREVGCEPCFENAAKCNNEINCMKVPPERIYKLLEPAVMGFWRS